MKTKKLLYIIPIIFFTLFLVLTVLLIVTKPNDPWSSVLPKTGLVELNHIFGSFEYNSILDLFSDFFMIVGLLGMIIMAGIGLYQLIRRKSLKKVDTDILLFGGMILLMIWFWLFFEMYSISYRPLPNDYSSSYPSTHVMIVTTTFFILSWMLHKRLNKRWVIVVAYFVSAASLLATFILRIVSGMHWFTDCLGGVLIGFTFVSLFLCLNIDFNNRK